MPDWGTQPDTIILQPFDSSRLPALANLALAIGEHRRSMTRDPTPAQLAFDASDLPAKGHHLQQAIPRLILRKDVQHAVGLVIAEVGVPELLLFRCQKASVLRNLLTQ